MAQHEEQAEVQIAVLQAGGDQMAGVSAEVQMAAAVPEHQVAASAPEHQIVAVAPEDQIAAAAPEDQILVAAAAAGVVEEQVIHLTDVDEHIKNHIIEIQQQNDALLQQNQALQQQNQAYQQQNQELQTALDTQNANEALMQAELQNSAGEIKGLREESRDDKEKSEEKIDLLNRTLEKSKDKIDSLNQELKSFRGNLDDVHGHLDNVQETVLKKVNDIEQSCEEMIAKTHKDSQQIFKEASSKWLEEFKALAQKLLEMQNLLESKETELQELKAKYQESENAEEPEDGSVPEPRIYNMRLKRGNWKEKFGAAATTPTRKTKALPAIEKKPDVASNALRFCRTCGAKQLFKVKPQILELLSGKEISERTCAICGNAVSRPKVPSKGDGEQVDESEKKKGETPVKAEKKPKTPTKSAAKRRKISNESKEEEKEDSEAAADKSDKENEGDRTAAPLMSFPVDNSADVDESGDGVVFTIAGEETQETGTGEGDDTMVGEEGVDTTELMDTQDGESKQPEEEKTLDFPRDRRPGRPPKAKKDKKPKLERTPSNAPVSEELAPLCDANDNEGMMFIDGRKKANRLAYAMLGLDPAVKDMMDPLAKPSLPFRCKMCKGVEFAHVKAFLKHMTTHTGEEPLTHPYKCKDCDKTFKQSRILQIHSMTHYEDRPFKCRFCEAAFKVRSGLWRHVKIHTNPKQHLCNICGQRFQEKRKLQNHEMIHSGELPYKCQHCGEGFRRLESMRRHEKTHTGERPHVCEFCGRSFKERGDIKKHLVLHTGEKPFKCTLCSYRSNRKEYVKLHMKTHGGGTIHKCNHCEMTFSSQLVCKKHEKEHFEPPKPVELVSMDEGQKDKGEEIIPTTLIIKQGDHPHQEMLSAVDFLLQFDSTNRVFASSSSEQEGTVTYVTQNATTEAGQEPTVAYVTQGEIAEGQEGMVTYVAQHTTSETGQETVTYVTESGQAVLDGEATTVAYITEEPNPEGGDQEATITYVTQTQ